MSTAGRVLVVLVLLSVIPWIALLSMTATLNSNWEQEIDRLKKDLAGFEQKIAATREELAHTREAIVNEQNERDRQLVVLRSKISQLEKVQASNQEAQQRITLQLQEFEQARKDADLAVATHKQELDETNAEIATKEGEVEKLKEQVGGLFSELEGLRKTFQSTMEENRKLLQRIGNASGGGARARTASLVH